MCRETEWGGSPVPPPSCKSSPEHPWYLSNLCSSTSLEAVPQTLSLRQSAPTLNYAHIKKIFLIFNLNILYIKPENEVNFCSSFSQWTWGIIDCRFCSSVWNAETSTGTCYSCPFPGLLVSGSKPSFSKLSSLRVMLSFLSCDLSPICMCPVKHKVPLCKHATPAEFSFPEESNLISHIIKSLFFMHWWICLQCVGSCNTQNLLCNAAGKASVFRVEGFGVFVWFFPPFHFALFDFIHLI